MYNSIKTVEYSFVVRDNDETKFTAIRIDEGKFKDVIYFYDDIQTGEETGDGGLNLNFTIRVVKSENDDCFIDKEEFHKLAGDILISCLEQGLTEGGNVDIVYRKNNSKSLAEQRGLQSESITLSKD